MGQRRDFSQQSHGASISLQNRVNSRPLALECRTESPGGTFVPPASPLAPIEGRVASVLGVN